MDPGGWGPWLPPNGNNYIANNWMGPQSSAVDPSLMMIVLIMIVMTVIMMMVLFIMITMNDRKHIFVL